jgi:hypothetical protein
MIGHHVVYRYHAIIASKEIRTYSTVLLAHRRKHHWQDFRDKFYTGLSGSVSWLEQSRREWLRAF